MKKFLLLSLLFSAVISTSVKAQPSTDKEAMLQSIKEKQAPMMVEKTGLSTAQANKVIEINFWVREEAATALQGLSGDDRSKKLAEIKALKEKKYSEIPLTPEQIKAVYAFYEDMGKNPPQKNG